VIIVKLSSISALVLGLAEYLPASGAGRIPAPRNPFNWTPCPQNPVLTGGAPGSWDEHIRERMWVLCENGKFHGWYGGWKGDYDKDASNLCHLGYATSDDGVHWKKYGDQPVYSGRWCEDICVLSSGGRYYMYLEDESSGKTVIHLLTSEDRIRWEEQGTVLEKFTQHAWEKDWAGTPLAWKEGEHWYLLYEGGDPGETGLAVSKDGYRWKRISRDPVLPRAQGWEDHATAPDSIIKKDGLYYLFYHATGRIWQTGLAVSGDLVHWTRCAGNPVIPYPSAVIVETEDRYLLYAHNDRDDPQGIYLYTSPK
jgi:predicted GH43/DUF377 family glycosyl hydrolase